MKLCGPFVFQDTHCVIPGEAWRGQDDLLLHVELDVASRDRDIIVVRPEDPRQRRLFLIRAMAADIPTYYSGFWMDRFEFRGRPHQGSLVSTVEALICQGWDGQDLMSLSEFGCTGRLVQGEFAHILGALAGSLMVDKFFRSNDAPIDFRSFAPG